MGAAEKLKRSSTDRKFGALVRWCPNEKCKLHGIDQAENECGSCGAKLDALTFAVVTTKHKMVYGGLVRESDVKACPEKLTIFECRQAVYYVELGSLGLATKGPNSRCRITGAAPEVTADGVTTICVMSPQAIDAWANEPWSK